MAEQAYQPHHVSKAQPFAMPGPSAMWAGPPWGGMGVPGVGPTRRQAAGYRIGQGPGWPWSVPTAAWPMAGPVGSAPAGIGVDHQHLLGLEPHTHQVRGLTTFDASHVHRYGVTTGTTWLADGNHVHLFEGVTTTDSEHTHHFSGVTGRAIPFFGAHLHEYRVETSPADQPRRHTHLVSGRTSIHNSPA